MDRPRADRAASGGTVAWQPGFGAVDHTELAQAMDDDPGSGPLLCRRSPGPSSGRGAEGPPSPPSQSDRRAHESDRALDRSSQNEVKGEAMIPRPESPQWTAEDSARYVSASELLGALVAACSSRLSQAEEADVAGVLEVKERFVQERRELTVLDQERCRQILADYPAVLAQLRTGSLP
ncbi:hypothetical protein GCM10010411_76210 [Actinomadura fulvescens]|uniref:Uncharacterized protein n=1 Tax=Actinomadura fulvescens TaxID=46160 RepID=A0ABP6CYJ0_9ACTN